MRRGGMDIDVPEREACGSHDRDVVGVGGLKIMVSVSLVIMCS